jgi:hypothetical protein
MVQKLFSGKWEIDEEGVIMVPRLSTVDALKGLVP